MLQTYEIEPDEPPFAGSVSASSFRIRRDLRGSHRFLPVVRGRIAGCSAGGTTVAVTMTLSLLTAIQMTVMSAMVVVLIWSFPVQLRDPFTLIPPALLVSVVAMLGLRFYPETRKAERLIQNALGHPPPR